MFAVLWLLGCPITPVGDTGVLPFHTGVGDTGTPDSESTSVDIGPCPMYSGFTAVGNQWTYDYNDGNGSYGTVDREVTTFSEEGDDLYQVEETVTQALTADAVEIVDVATWVWECNSVGLWLRRVQGHEEDTFAGTISDSYYTRRFGDKPLLVLGRDIGMGSTWSSSIRVVRQRNGTEEQLRVTAESEVTDSGSITVTAGSFSALEITSTADEDTVSWWAVGVGRLSEGAEELTSYSP